MKHPGRRLVDGAGSTRAENGRRLAPDLGLDEEIAERRVYGVGDGRGEDDFGVARDLDRPACPRPVGDREAAKLDVVLGRDGDLGMGVEIVFVAPKLHSRL